MLYNFSVVVPIVVSFFCCCSYSGIIWVVLGLKKEEGLSPEVQTAFILHVWCLKGNILDIFPSKIYQF